MRNLRVLHIRALATIVVALLAMSCSRALPTAPERAITRAPGNDPFATVGLENQVVVTLAPGVDVDEIATQYGAMIVKSDDGRTASLRPANGQTPLVLMNQLGADPRIETSEPNSWTESAEARQQSFAFDDGFGNATTYAEQPALQAIEADHAHDVATGRGVKVAILDTGCDMRHPALSSHVVAGWDFVGNDPDPSEQRGNLDSDRDGVFDEAYGHGTHVAGIVRLVAPDAQLMIVRVLDSEGRGDLVNVAAGIRWAIANGAKVINLSLGTRGEADALEDVLEEADLAGVIVVAAAGNTGGTGDNSRPDKLPARSSHVADVAACDVNVVPAPFSSNETGKVLLAAPGIGVRSTFPGGGYKLWTGTSMSSPFVAGVAALLAEKHPTWNLDIMEGRLERTTTPWNLKATSPLVEVDAFGSGMLNAWRALAPDFVAAPTQVPSPSEIRPR